MFFRRNRDASMLTRIRSPSQSYHVAAVCGEPSGRTVAITAGLAFRSIASTSGGSGGFGTLLSLLAPIAAEPEIRLDDRRGTEIRSRAFTFAGLEIGARSRDEL